MQGNETMNKVRKAILYGRVAAVTIKTFFAYQLFYKKNEKILF
jgi:hypothetical protein